MQKSLLPTLLEKDAPSYKTVEVLSNVLTEAIDEGKIRNIALTGPYGSGKSSILRTLQSYNKGFHYLPISLATLQAKEQSGEDNELSDEEVENLNRKIEYSILQQLIYREKSSTVPNSRLKRIVHIGKEELRKYGICGVLFLISYLIAFEPTWLKVDSIYNLLNWGKVNVFFDSLAVIYMFLCFYWTIKYVIKSFANSKLNKLNLKDGIIEMKEENSIFNKHLDEILYFFQVTEYNVVIIEDLDRFGTSNIFLKLRELNQLINESKIVGRNVVFLYAVKDDVFINEERTKFFDYITTVIPVINPSNSKDKLIEFLRDRGLKDGEVKDGDLADMAFFIQDMRILKNIANEFKQYRDNLCEHGNQNLNMTKLLAMMVYKNYHPKDFAELHRREGKMYKCISMKPKFVDEALKALVQEKEALEKSYQLYLDNRHLQIVELRQLFLYELRRTLKESLFSFNVNNTYYGIIDIARNDNLFYTLMSSSNIQYQYYYYYGSPKTGEGCVDFNAIDKNVKFSERLNVLKQPEASFVKQRRNLQKKVIGVKACTLQNLLTKFGIGNSDLYKGVGLSPLMDVFIRRGFIDEEYYDYISYFYEGMVSLSDRDLLLSIKRDIKKEYSYHIDKVENFVKELQYYMLESEAILNNDLLNYLAKEEKRYSDFYVKIMSHLEKENAPLDFLAQYYQLGKQHNKVLMHYIEWDREKAWNNIEHWKNQDEKDILKEGWLKFCGAIDEVPCEWLNSNYGFLTAHADNIGLKRCKEIIEDCCFETLNGENPQLLQCVIDNCSYILSIENLTLILTYLSPNNDKTGKEYLTLSRIRKTGCKELISYVEEKISIALPCLSHSAKDETAEVIFYLLNSEELNDEQKEEYLSDQQNQLETVDGIAKAEMITMAYKLYLVKPTWENTLTYYNNSSKSMDVFYSYVDKFASVLAEKELVGEDDKIDFIISILGCNRLSLESYKSITNSTDFFFDGEKELESLDKQRLSLLLQSGKLLFKEKNTTVLKNTDIYIEYLLYHSESFFKEKSPSLFTSLYVAEHIIASYKFSDQQKMELIPLIPTDFLTNSQKLADLVIEVLVKTNYSVLADDVLKSLIRSSTNHKNKVVLVTKMIESSEYNDTEIAALIALLGNKYQEIAERHKQPVVNDYNWNQELLALLKRIGFISSTKETKDGIRVIPKRVQD